jgi:hypothetical protein
VACKEVPALKNPQPVNGDHSLEEPHEGQIYPACLAADEIVGQRSRPGGESAVCILRDMDVQHAQAADGHRHLG